MDDLGRRATHWLLPPHKVPTGETEPIERFFPDPPAAPLRDHDLDDVFSDLVRDAHGRATMTVQGQGAASRRRFRAELPVAVVWAPKPPAGQERNFICFEPMAGITNAINMAHKGTYKELQSIAPGGDLAGELLDQAERIRGVPRPCEPTT